MDKRNDTTVVLPLCPSAILIFYVNIGKELLAHLLMVASLLIAASWKSDQELAAKAWERKIRYMCLISKLTAINRYSAGRKSAVIEFTIQSVCFLISKYK